MKNDTIYESYFDGLSPEFKKNQEKMTEQESEDSLEKERKKCQEMIEW